MKTLNLLFCIMTLLLLSFKQQSIEISGKWTHLQEHDQDGLELYIKR